MRKERKKEGRKEGWEDVWMIGGKCRRMGRVRGGGGMILADCCSYSYSLSCKFSKPGKGGRRTRLMLVNKVALGKCKVWRVLQRR